MSKQKLFLVLLIIAVGWVVVYPTNWWSWGFAALPVAWSAYRVAQTSRAWLDAMGTNIAELDDSAVPTVLEPVMLELSKLGMGYATSFKSHDAGVLMASQRGDIVATVRSGYGGDVVLATGWPGARLHTAQAIGIPMAPGDYVQLVPGAALKAQLETHRAGVATLTHGLGEPCEPNVSVEALIDSIQRRRAAFRRRRYRQTAKVLVLFAIGWYGRPVDQQLGLQVRSGVLWTLAGALVAIATYTWWWAGEEASSEATALAISSTLIYGGLLALILAGIRVRRRFLPRS